MVQLDMGEMTNVMRAVDHYNGLFYHFTQLDPAQREALGQYMIKFNASFENARVQLWKDVNLYVVKQQWANTTCGWGGIGGQAFTDSYTTVIENHETGAVFVYYSGVLAYVALDNEHLQRHRMQNWAALPGVFNNDLETIYLKDRKRK